MLKRFHDALKEREIVMVETRQADVLDKESLPSTWTQYDLVVSASMLEYVPRTRLPEALAATPPSARRKRNPCRLHHQAQLAHPADDWKMVAIQPL